MRIYYFPHQKVKKHIILTAIEKKIIQHGAHLLGSPYYQTALKTLDATGCAQDACVSTCPCPYR
jgi:hypothetical protein